jgi:hypothetical protein
VNEMKPNPSLKSEDQPEGGETIDDVEKKLKDMLNSLGGRKNRKKSSTSTSSPRSQKLPTQTEEIIDADGIVYTPSPSQGEEYQFSRSRRREERLEDDEGDSGPIKITEDGEILGGYRLDYNNLTQDQYKTISRSARERMKKMDSGSKYPIHDEDSSEDDENVETEPLVEHEIEENSRGSEQDQSDEESLKKIQNHILPVSASTGAGIAELWEDIRLTVVNSVIHPVDWEKRHELSPERVAELMRMVREHKKAIEERRRIAADHIEREQRRDNKGIARKPQKI